MPVKTQKTALKKMLDRQAGILFGHVNYGGCSACPLTQSCLEANDEDTSCRLATKATAEFLSFATESSHLATVDVFGIRSLAAIHASMAVAEAYFKVYGSVEVLDGAPSFSDLHKQWVKLNARFQEGLAKYGLTPAGRRLLDSRTERNKNNSFEDFIDAKFKVVEKKRLPPPEDDESLDDGDWAVEAT